jgi:hypothetical protein
MRRVRGWDGMGWNGMELHGWENCEKRVDGRMREQGKESVCKRENGERVEGGWMG